MPSLHKSIPFLALRERGWAFMESRFVRNVAAVATGIAMAQAISLAFYPFLTRLYGPDAFGALAAFTAILNVTTPLATLGFANAIVMPDSDEGATAVARLSVVCAAIVAPLVLILVHFLQEPLAAWAGLESRPALLYLLPLALLLSALLSVINQAAIREGLFKMKARTHVETTLLMNVGKLAGGLLASSGVLLIVISLVAKALNTLILLIRVPKRGVLQVRSWFGTAGIRKAAREQMDFALYRMPQSIINAASLGLPVIVITRLFGAGVAGQYSITVLVLGAPVMLFGQSVGEVFYPRITQAIRKESPHTASLILKAAVALALAGVLPFGVVALVGDVLFPWGLGSDWGRAGEFAQWVSLWMAAVLFTRPAVAAMPALRMQGALLAYEALMTAARVGAIFLGAKFGDDLTAVALFSLANVAGYLLLLGLVHHKVYFLRKRAGRDK